jgi:hypothetical protein
MFADNVEHGGTEMKRTTLVWTCLMSCVAASAFIAMAGRTGAAPALKVPPGMPKPGPTLLEPRPDLVITDFGLTSWGGCTSGQTVFTFGVGVKNQGNASWSGVEPAVLVRDLHPGVLDAWGTGVGIDPPLAPGETRHLQVPIGYYFGNPGHMGALGHPFQATVNANHIVHEGNYTNNAGPGPAVWNGIRVIMVFPEACKKVGSGVPKP